MALIDIRFSLNIINMLNKNNNSNNNNDNGGGGFFKGLCMYYYEEDTANERPKIQSTISQNQSEQDILNRTIAERENDLLSKPIFEILKILYEQRLDQQRRNQIFQALSNKRLNPILDSRDKHRDDIQYYIPQLLTYLVFEIDLNDDHLIKFLIKASQLHYIFAHCCYFYLNTLTVHAGEQLEDVKIFLQHQFLPQMSLYKNTKLCGFSLAKCSLIEIQEIEPNSQELDAIGKYGTQEEDELKIREVRGIQICNYNQDGYMSTPKFWKDLVNIGQLIIKCNPRRIGLIKALKDLNKRLPAAVYIPFLKQDLRYYTILNIDTKHARVFNTKTRAPYSIYIEVFRQEEQFLKPSEQVIKKSVKRSNTHQIISHHLIAQTLSKPLTVFQDQNSLKLQRIKIQQERRAFTRSTFQPGFRQHIIPPKSESVVQIRKRRHSEDIKQMQKVQEENQREMMSIINENEKIEKTQIQQPLRESTASFEIDMPETQIPSYTGSNSYVDKYFDKPFKEVEEQIRSRSIYKKFKTWKVVNIMVKTGDDLKQEQFAMQLINQFNIIFNKEQTGLLLRPYEVISLGPDCGILQMVTDASPLARIMKTMALENIPTLKQFFKFYLKGKQKEAKRNFCRSLAAYSLVTYFLQVKDRHNQNILLHKDGYIVHIDFGFFLSNMPGKGVQLEKKVPFKFMSAYVDVLGGYDSLLFLQFRGLFLKGFRAALKHKNEIIMLVKMMYSSHGQSMPCFTKGQTSIDELQQRFNPSMRDLQAHCNNLINQSLDNWRARWYDRFQYWLQGIYY